MPTNDTTVSLPNGEVHILRAHPERKLNRFRRFCKYFCKTHGQWWLMHDRDYFAKPSPDQCVILCACGYSHCETKRRIKGH
jgi:hypothetical protein